MTIGIGAIGNNAGLAVWKALQSVELVTSGSIGGFATFVILDSEYKSKTFCTQRGGSQTLFTYGDSVMKYPPQEVIDAPFAGVVSSGPDRQEPISALIPVADGVGLVTGHRIPAAIGKNGISVNWEVFQLMKEGIPADEAVKTIMQQNPKIDTGLIALDIRGNMGMMNSDRVNTRLDISSAHFEKGGAKIMVLNNEIYPHTIVADIAANIGMEVMLADRKPDLVIKMYAGIKIQYDENERVIINDNNVVQAIYTADTSVLKGKMITCVVPYLGNPVIKNGKTIGVMMNEPVAVLDEGVVVNFTGAPYIERDVRSI